MFEVEPREIRVKYGTAMAFKKVRVPADTAKQMDALAADLSQYLSGRKLSAAMMIRRALEALKNELQTNRGIMSEEEMKEAERQFVLANRG